MQNELDPALLGSSGLNPWHANDSAGRVQMLSNHLGQSLVISEPTERACQTGMEAEYAKYTFKVAMPADGVILNIIDLYPPSLGIDSIKMNPETTVIYEDNETKEIGCFFLTDHSCNHQYFGFKYKASAGYDQLVVGAAIRKGTVFLDSPSVTDNGGYKFGIEANAAFMTHPAVAEDGILVNRDFLEKLKFKTYETRSISWGKKKFALNLYGDENNYKPFPEIGDYIRDDAILMALRPYDSPELSIVEQSIYATMEPDLTFDSTVYANGPGGRIVDIRINHNLSDRNYAEKHMDSQIQKYDFANRQYCKRIVDIWKALHRMKGDGLQITPQFSQLVVKCQAVASEAAGQKVIKSFRKSPLDTYLVDITVEYTSVPGIGYKITDCHGKTAK